jgi:hypothetical protein
MRRLLRFTAVAPLVLATVITGATAAGAGETLPQGNTCSGTTGSPGVLAGFYAGNVTVTGVCDVDGGAAMVTGNLTLAPGSALNAAFGENDVAKTGKSSLTVLGNVSVGSGAILVMGCEEDYFPCVDNPDATSQDHVNGYVEANQALTVIIHDSTINGNLTYNGGGGGLSCDIPDSGILAPPALDSPPYFDAEDNTVGGNLSITNLETCWMGALRNHVRGYLVDSNNTMGSTDGDEVLANVISGSISCFSNSPAVQYGDSDSSPNQVGGAASGECAFNVKQPDPAPSGTPEPISVKG